MNISAFLLMVSILILLCSLFYIIYAFMFKRPKKYGGYSTLLAIILFIAAITITTPEEETSLYKELLSKYESLEGDYNKLIVEYDDYKSLMSPYENLAEIEKEERLRKAEEEKEEAARLKAEKEAEEKLIQDKIDAEEAKLKAEKKAKQDMEYEKKKADEEAKRIEDEKNKPIIIGNYELSEVNASGDQFARYITGVVKNNTGKDLSYVQILIPIYDNSGNKISDAIDNINNLKANSTWKFKAMSAGNDEKWSYSPHSADIVGY